MRGTDQMLARYASEIEERQTFMDGIVEAAEKENRDLNPNEMELVTRARERLTTLSEQMEPLKEARRISHDSHKKLAELSRFMDESEGKPKREIEYRSAGAYVLDRWRAGLGMGEAAERLDLYHRTAAHQTTADNEGLLPEQIMGPLVNWVDNSRPLVSALGARQLPSGSWSRPRVTQHTNVAAQSSGEKTELVSRKMLIEKVPVTATTYGGYVNVSRQDIDWTQPQIMDIVINDLAGQYAIQTEDAAATALEAAATAGATGLGTTPTDAEVAAAFWSAAAAVFTATAGNGNLIAVMAPNMLGLFGPLFAPVNPQNAQSTGFNAGNFGTGAVGAISGVPFYVSAAITAGTGLILSTSAAEIYEDRIGPLQVVEPSVLGVQVAYAGYFAPLVMSATGIIKVTAA